MSIPKAALYFSPTSVWSAATLLALAEKGYGTDELDLRVVDLATGKNFDPTFLRLNPKATVPTLIVPLEKTLSQDVDSRYKALADTKSVIEFLDKSRTAISRTNTTSHAPAPALSPATMASMTSYHSVVQELHSNAANPDHLRNFNAFDDASLQTLALHLLPSLKIRRQALLEYITDAESDKIHVSSKVENFWKEKLQQEELLVDVLSKAGSNNLSETDKVKRSQFFQIAEKTWKSDLKIVLDSLNHEIVGPYTLGDQFSIADLHLIAWLARIVKLAGGAANDDGNTSLGKVEAHIGGGFSIAKNYKPVEIAQRIETGSAAQSRLAAVWDAVQGRPSWKKVYGQGLI